MPRKREVTAEGVVELLQEHTERPFVDNNRIADYFNVSTQAVRDRKPTFMADERIEIAKVGKSNAYYLADDYRSTSSSAPPPAREPKNKEPEGLFDKLRLAFNTAFPYMAVFSWSIGIISLMIAIVYFTLSGFSGQTFLFVAWAATFGGVLFSLIALRIALSIGQATDTDIFHIIRQIEGGADHE